MNFPRWSLWMVLLTGCASLTPPAPPEPELPSGAPWGLAWIPPSGEVAIRAGAIEHVLYPEATAHKLVRTPLSPESDADSAAPRAVLSLPPPRASPASQARSDGACDVKRDAVPAWFISQRVERVLSGAGGNVCVERPKK
jgi:hypothetical protein